MFSEARRRSPSVVFIDEIDALTPSRKWGYGKPPKSGLLSTLLAELDGLESKGSCEFLLTIGATNVPWQMDDAILSRFGKRIYVPLPDPETREKILSIHIDRAGYEADIPRRELVKATNGYSGRDIEQLCSEAIQLMLTDANDCHHQKGWQ